MEKMRYKLQNKNKKARENDQRGKKKPNVADTNVVDDKFDNLLLVSTNKMSKFTYEWIMDSWCSYHMCPIKDWFSTYSSIEGGVVLMEKNSPCKITGIGTIQIRMHGKIIKTLSNVWHVLDLKKNLVSLGMID